MAITPHEASVLADEKKKLTPQEVAEADAAESNIDALVRRSYDGGKSCVVSIARPTTRVLAELERRYVKAGWGFTVNQAEPGRQGFSIVLTSPLTK